MIVSLLLIVLSASALAENSSYQFPDGFVFGTATAAYQIEGGWNEDGKGESIYDRSLHEHPEVVTDGSNGDVACDSYHKYKEDVQLLKNIGVDFYRFSISWPRILPNGTTDQINQAGIDYYNNLIDELVANNIKPYVTMYHYDLPQALQDQGGWPERKLADYFVDYARILFETYGDRVQHWFTFNEPFEFCQLGYGMAMAPPYLTNEQYECGHTVLLAHARTYQLYNEEFREDQNGEISIVLDAMWWEPGDPKNDMDVKSAEIMRQMTYGWFAHPIVYGNYADILLDIVPNLNIALPEFIPEEQELLKGSYDFFALNHYTTQLVYYNGSETDNFDLTNVVRDVDPSWKVSPTGKKLAVVPWGLRKILVWIKENYNSPRLLISENGYTDTGELEDYDRADYYKSYLTEALKAIYEEDCNLIGYTVWSLMDNLEWTSGYTEKYGLHYVDFDDPERPRTRKLSSYVYSNIIKTREIDMDYYPDWPPNEM